jgi:hypothetical protein
MTEQKGETDDEYRARKRKWASEPGGKCRSGQRQGQGSAGACQNAAPPPPTCAQVRAAVMRGSNLHAPMDLRAAMQAQHLDVGGA